jgi:hypothetical protein
LCVLELFIYTSYFSVNLSNYFNPQRRTVLTTHRQTHQPGGLLQQVRMPARAPEDDFVVVQPVDVLDGSVPRMEYKDKPHCMRRLVAISKTDELSYPNKAMVAAIVALHERLGPVQGRSGVEPLTIAVIASTGVTRMPLSARGGRRSPSPPPRPQAANLRRGECDTNLRRDRRAFAAVRQRPNQSPSTEATSEARPPTGRQ